ELFEPEIDADDGAVTAGTALRDGDAIRLVRAGGGGVAAACGPLADGTVADAVFSAGSVRRLPGAREDGVLVLGCDPALRLIERMAPADQRIVTGPPPRGGGMTGPPG